jgi:hypothetical protein
MGPIPAEKETIFKSHDDRPLSGSRSSGRRSAVDIMNNITKNIYKIRNSKINM